MKRCNKSQEVRDTLALVIRLEPQARKMYKHLMNMGAKNIRPDYKYVRQQDGKYEQMPDFDVWHCEVRGGAHVAMVRHHNNDTGSGEWTLHS